MAEFIYNDFSCKLKFGSLEFSLPLNEQTANLIDESLSNNVPTDSFKSIEDINEFYNKTMDGIDKILGEGASESIMERFEHPGALEIMSVVNFIATEFNNNYKTSVEEMKKTANIPNRETRRANTKGGRR